MWSCLRFHFPSLGMFAARSKCDIGAVTPALVGGEIEPFYLLLVQTTLHNSGVQFALKCPDQTLSSIFHPGVMEVASPLILGWWWNSLPLSGPCEAIPNLKLTKIKCENHPQLVFGYIHSWVTTTKPRPVQEAVSSGKPILVVGKIPFFPFPWTGHNFGCVWILGFPDHRTQLRLCLNPRIPQPVRVC